jgi:hypothetical protein
MWLPVVVVVRSVVVGTESFWISAVRFPAALAQDKRGERALHVT